MYNIFSCEIEPSGGSFQTRFFN